MASLALPLRQSLAVGVAMPSSFPLGPLLLPSGLKPCGVGQRAVLAAASFRFERLPFILCSPLYRSGIPVRWSEFFGVGHFATAVASPSPLVALAPLRL